VARRVALTGGTGFIGRHVTSALAGEGIAVRSLIRDTPPESAGASVRWVRGDLRSPESLEELVRGADTVIHCAGLVRGSSYRAFDEVNAEGTASLAAAAEKGPTPERFLLISSLAARQPRLSWYAASKRRAEERLAEAAGDSLASAVFRPTAVYGPGDREMRPLFLAMRRGVLPVVGHAEGRITLMHVHDLARAVLAWVRADEPVTGSFELHDGTPGGYAWSDVARIVDEAWHRRVRPVYIPESILFTAAALNLAAAKLIGTAPLLTPGKVRELTHPDWTCSNEAATGALGWEPRIDLPTALRRDIATG